MMLPKLEILHHTAQTDDKKGSIVFIHGAFMGAWCWQNNLLPYFAAKGYDTYAPSLRGHGESASDGRYKTRRLRHYVEDVSQFLSMLSGKIYLVGHSMGGHVVQHVLNQSNINIEKSVLIATVPPKGVWRITLKTAWHYPFLFAKVNLLHHFLPLFADANRVQQFFFGTERDDKLLQYVCKNLEDESYLAYLDTLFLDLPKPKPTKTSILVIGGKEDFFFNEHDVSATANAFGVKPVFFANRGHNLFMEKDWESVAACMNDFFLNFAF
jgi:pimeloyl-ACP methyl ester carboxylesterase